MKTGFSSACLAIAALVVAMPVAGQTAAGKPIYDATCSGCHGPGILGAPKFGDAAQWAARGKSLDSLVKSAVAGTAKGMPPKGGRAELSDAQLRSAIEYMMSGGAGKPSAVAATAPPAKPNPPPRATPGATAPAAPAAPAAAMPAPPVAASTATVAATAAAPAAPAAATIATLARAAPTPVGSAEINAFNRLLKPLGRINRPAVESGIHDPGNDMTLQLQPPDIAFAPLPKSPAGNHVDWVKALEAKAIAPRWDRVDPAAAAIVMDLNIVREVKGSMPDVVYPHKQHTEWLDCSNCHPKIFVPQKGANQISMASILLGQQCGVCHGKVAFPVSECRLCHSRKKAATTIAAEAKP
jgi:c(7)-type cytochrome triheme protein